MQSTIENHSTCTVSPHSLTYLLLPTRQVMILDHDKVSGRVALSTKALEPSPGDMLKDMNAVFEKAIETAKRLV